MIQEKIFQIKENTKIGEDILFKIVKAIRPGITTYKLNQIAEEEFKKNKALPSAKFHNPKYSISIGVNEEVLFGEISKAKKIKTGDVVTLGLGIFKNGYFSDMALTLIVDQGSLAKKRLVIGTAKTLYNIVQKLKSGIMVKNISDFIENNLKKYGLKPIHEIMGHGIGKHLHETPAIPTCKDLPFVDYNYKLRKNEIICLEIIATFGSGAVIRKNKKGFITRDKKPTAYFELPVLIKDKKVEILGKKIFEFIKSLK